jgi:hypothetical protein
MEEVFAFDDTTGLLSEVTDDLAKARQLAGVA